MGYCEKVLDLANRQVGYKEETSKGKNWTKYSRYFDVEAWQWFNTKKQGAAWCAIFICWLFCQNEIIGPKRALKFLGCPAPKDNCAAGVPYLYKYLEAKGYKQVDKTKGRPGDIIVLYSKSHVGIINTVSGGKYNTIEGNKSDKVGRGSYKINSSSITAVFRPDYAALDKELKPSEPVAVKPEPVTAPVTAPKTYQMKVTTKVDPLRLRSYASGSAPIICLMKKGSIVTYLGSSSGDWLKVKYKTMVGYAHKNYLTKV